MNGDISVARRYAAALFGMAQKRGVVEAVAQNLGEVADVAAHSRDLMGVMHHPLLTLDKKKSILRQVFGAQIRPDVEKFLFLVVEKNRAVMLPQIVREFNRLADEFRGEADAEVVSATPLSSEQVAQLQAALLQKFGVKARLRARVDPEVLGGVRVRVGDKLLDATVRTQIERIGERLKRVKVT